MTTPTGCEGCRNTDASAFAIPFTMAFQPIVDVSAGAIWGYAGYAGLSLLARFQTDLIKIDMELVRDIDSSRVKQAIVHALVGLAKELGMTLLAEGVETAAELAVLKAAGISLFQGYYFARPETERFRSLAELAQAA